MLSIQSGVPVSKTTRAAPPARRKYPFVEMDVDHMFFVPGRTKNTLATHASTIGKKLNRKFVTRLTYMVEQDGVWHPATASTEGAVLGVGVWRTA
jgi:hypothetical protein